MQCEIRGMVDMNEASRKSSDTLPKPGRVTEVCREWLVHEDGALAYRLQNEEIKQHYSGNKFRNATVREDFPKAKDEQRKEEEEAATMHALYEKMVREQEQIDAHLAQKIAEKLDREEIEKKRAAEEKDCEIALELQIVRNGDSCSDHESEQSEELEKKRLERERALKREQALDAVAQQTPSSEEMPQLRTQSQPCSPHYVESLSHDLRAASLSEVSPRIPSDSSEHNSQPPESNSLSDLSDFCLQPSPGMSEEDARRLQEEQDAELARLLQEQEGKRRGDMLDRDRLLAVEAQDRELAKMLQERERAKAKRAKERAKQKALLRKQQQQNAVEGAEPEQEAAHCPAVRPMDLDLSGALNARNNNHTTGKLKPRYPDPEAIEVLPSASPEPSTSQGLPNIAMAIDPTYPRRMQSGELRTSAVDTPNSNVSSPAMSLPPPDFDDEDDDNPAPPYMPIQGQRRTSSLEKKAKKGKQKKEGKDGCKQQ